MFTLLIIIHLIVCFFLIGVVLIQGGKGAELGSAFGGGSSQTLFGGRGAATFLSKLTTVVAVIFMITSLLLAVISVKQKSVIKEVPTATQGKTVPAPSKGVTPAGGGVKPAEEAPKSPEKK
ncbi:MAG: preprotein translocase subunit SecG [Nitrospirae bacterium]|nr:MAG: preprotein translocase subunit SecG [Nitrospirota bacterium]